MSRSVPFVVIVAVAIVSVAIAEDPVHFADPRLKAAVEEELQVSDPTPAEMLALTLLDAANKGITDLTGLEHATNLQTLYIRWNDLSDISPLSALVNLQYLDAHGGVVNMGAFGGTAQASKSYVEPPPADWKSQIVFPDDPFCARGISRDSARWVKFTILLEPYDPSIVYFQDSRKYVFHYGFATDLLEPFIGMTTQQFNAVTLFEQGQQAILGTVILPPLNRSGEPEYDEYGIQFVRQDPYSREDIRDLFNLVKANIEASPDVQAFYFPTYEQQASAQTDRDWFESQGIPLGSTGRWAKGNTAYSQGWAFGELKFFPAADIELAYHSGLLRPSDILLTDGIPAELPFVDGIISLVPSTPNSHVAILARTYAVPFVHLALPGDAELAQQLVGRRIIFSAYEDAFGMSDVRLIDCETGLDDAFVAQILELKQPPHLAISPMAEFGAYGVSTEGLMPSDIQYVGGKAAGFGILREAIPQNSPKAIALTFDVWNAFLDQPLLVAPRLDLGPGEHILIWADGDDEQGPVHTSFKLSRGGESIGLFDIDGVTPIDVIHFGGQSDDVSYGRSTDGGDTWQPFEASTPGQPNSGAPPETGRGLVINEFMADNKRTIQDPDEPGEYPDWIELYNASDETITLNGMYVTDDVDDPTKWQFPPVFAGGSQSAVVGDLNGDHCVDCQDLWLMAQSWLDEACLSQRCEADVDGANGVNMVDLALLASGWGSGDPSGGRWTLRQDIAWRLSKYSSYPPGDMQALSRDLASIRNLFTNPDVTQFSDGLRQAVLAVLTDPQYDFNANANLRFRSSTNVEDSLDFVGAGLYESYSGCLADELDGNDSGPCRCDPNRASERGVFRAIRRVFASFYNDNAYLERLRHDVNEAQVGMALVVHHSFPDAIELANGVATVEMKGPGANSTVSLVTQQGAVSVTNPQDASIAEEVTVTRLPSGSIVPPRLARSSSLIPLGATVMVWPDDYMALTDLLILVSDRFSEVTGQTEYVLDLEYKKVAPGGQVLPSGGLIVKQVRQVPSPDETASVTPFLLNTPANLEVFPGEFEVFGDTDVFADHRLKSRWQLETHATMLDSSSLGDRLYSELNLEYLDDDQVRTIAGQMSALPSAAHSFDGEDAADSWELPGLSNPRSHHLLTTGIPTSVSPAENPIFTLADLGTYAFNLPYKCLALDVEYGHPVMSWHQQLWPYDPPSGLSTTMRNTVYLWSRPGACPQDVWIERSSASDGISIRTSFYYPPPPTGYPDWAGHTAPLQRWDRTVIQGLTSEPIVLQGYYSQTYRPEHHNLIENFLFEPRLEPGITPGILDELSDMNIRFIHLIMDNRQDGDESEIATYGFE